MQLRRLLERNAARARIVARYRAELDGVGGIQMPFAADGDVDPAHHLAVIVLPRRPLAGRVPRVARGARHPDERPLPADPPLLALPRARREAAAPATDAVADRLVTLPLYPHMSEADVATVTAAVLDAI